MGSVMHRDAIARFAQAAALGAAAWTIATATGARAQDERPEDAAGDVTSVAPGAEDPLGWIGDHEIAFVARVREDGAELRSGPDPNYRVVRQVERGTLLPVVSDRAHGFVKVLVPGGFRAYVHARYVDVAEDGTGVVNADRVNVRSVPSSIGDYPIGQVDRGERLRVWGSTGSEAAWLEVDAPGNLPLWLPEGVFDLEDAAAPGVLVEIASARAAAERAWDERNEESRQRAEVRRAGERGEELLARARDAIREQEARGIDADYAAARALLAEARALATGPDQETLRGAITAQEQAVAALERTLESQKLLETSRREIATLEESFDQERTRLAQEVEREKARAEQEAARRAAGVTTPAYPTGTAGEWIGFLRSRPDDAVHPIALEQGVRLVAWLRCSSGRVRLADFGGRQVVVRGKVVAADGAPAIPLIDVERLQVLNR